MFLSEKENKFRICPKQPNRKKNQETKIIICVSSNGSNGLNGENGSNGSPGTNGLPGLPGLTTTLSNMVFSALPPTSQGQVILDSQAFPFTELLVGNSDIAIFQNQGWIFSEGSYLITISFQTQPTGSGTIANGSMFSLVHVASNLQIGIPLNVTNQSNLTETTMSSFFYNWKLIGLDGTGQVNLPPLPTGSQSHFGSWIVQKVS
jgi:hypothetical protein